MLQIQARHDIRAVFDLVADTRAALNDPKTEAEVVGGLAASGVVGTTNKQEVREMVMSVVEGYAAYLVCQRAAVLTGEELDGRVKNELEAAFMPTGMPVEVARLITESMIHDEDRRG